MQAKKDWRMQFLNLRKMCYFNSIAANAKDIAVRYGKKRAGDSAARYVVAAFSNPEYPVVTNDEYVRIFTWGLIPHWLKPRAGESAKDASIRAEAFRKGTYNARAETVFEKPSFREPIMRRRCLIPATGFFEYHHSADGSAEPYYIFLKGEKIFSMGGIFDFWRNPETGNESASFSQITTEPNPLMRKIHNGGKNPFRMPLIIRPEDENKWLDPNLDRGSIEKFFKPFPQSDMDAYQVESDFSKRPDDPNSTARAMRLF